MPNDRVGLAQTACLRCREQKLKCSREQPQCARCTKFGAVCSFPQPPDRKLIAVRRENDKRRAAESNIQGEHDAATSRNTRPRLSSPRTSYPTNTDHVLASKGSRAGVRLDHLSDTVQQLLQDRYFSCIFNSSLTFHRPTFQREFKEGRIPAHTLLAMYALAAILSASESAFTHEGDSELRPLGDLRELSEAWAIQAGRAALQDIDQPTMHAVQTCQILTWYWFSRGDAVRNSMFCGIAYKAIRTVVLDPDVVHMAATNRSPTKLESLRRCFWASWLTNSVNSDQYAIGGAADTQVLAMPLPMSEHAFLEGIVEPTRTLGKSQFQESMQNSIKDSDQEPSIMGETVKITLLWARVRDHIEARRSNPDKESWCNAFLLQNALNSWIKRLPHSFIYSKRNLYEQLIVKGQSIYIFLHAMYHQCCLMLHSSLVPYLCGSSLSSDGMPSEVSRISAEIALSHAQALSNLGADLLFVEWAPVQIVPFVGYTMYVAATVHLAVISRDPGLAETARKHLASSLRLLKCMKPTWAILERLWCRLHRLYDAQMSKNGMNSNGSTPAEASAILRESATDSAIGTRSEISCADELLRSTVSYFGLGRLQNSPASAAQYPSNTSVLDDVISAMSDESVSHILELNGPRACQNTLLGAYEQPPEKASRQPDLPVCDTQNSPNTLSEHSMLPAANQPSTQTQILNQMDKDSGETFASLDPATLDNFNQFENWWQIDPNDVGQVPFPFDDIFGTDLTLK